MKTSYQSNNILRSSTFECDCKEHEKMPWSFQAYPSGWQICYGNQWIAWKKLRCRTGTSIKSQTEQSIFRNLFPALTKVSITMPSKNDFHQNFLSIWQLLTGEKIIFMQGRLDLLVYINVRVLKWVLRNSQLFRQTFSPPNLWMLSEICPSQSIVRTWIKEKPIVLKSLLETSGKIHRIKAFGPMLKIKFRKDLL